MEKQCFLLRNGNKLLNQIKHTEYYRFKIFLNEDSIINCMQGVPIFLSLSRGFMGAIGR